MKLLLPLFTLLLLASCNTSDSTADTNQTASSSSTSLATSSTSFSAPPVSDIERKSIEEGATAGNANAQFQMGAILFESSKPEDQTAALSWFEKAAAQGEVRAMFNAGLMYQQGMGTRKNIPKSTQYFEQADAKGDARAAFNLGLLYYEGGSTPQDFTKARTYFEKAAKSGLPAAALNVGVMYIRGEGIASDPVSAAAWFAVAKRTGHPQAAEYYAQVTSTMPEADRQKVAEKEKTLVN